MIQRSGLPAETSKGSLSSGRAISLARQLFASAIDLFYPPRCIQCRRAGVLLCQDCQQAITVPPPVREANSPLAERRSTAEFGGAVRDAIHALKYKNQRRYAIPLSQRLNTQLADSGWLPTLITAVPLHEKRMRKRGYNQSVLLAEPLARAAGLPFDPSVIWRTRDTPAQVGLGMQDRQLNVAGAFQAEADRAANQAVVIVDDVYTTGATLRECARVLLEAGATKVWALTVASAARFAEPDMA
jgi:ComF family protein